MPDHRPVLKVCGLTRVADVRCAEAAGASFCGLIVEIQRSPRSITREQAVLLARGCRARPVLVVEAMPPEEIAALAEAVSWCGRPRPHIELRVQLHGGDEQYVREVGEALDVGARAPVPRAFVWRPVGLPECADDREALVADALAEIEAALEAGASAIVLDTRTSGGTGGSGRTCDWEAAAEIVRRTNAPVLLAGGLGPENVREALRVTGAAGADLSSSLEAAPGRKSPLRLRELAAAWAETMRECEAGGL